MHVRQTRRVVTPLLACLLALGALSGAAPAYAEEPQPASTSAPTEPTAEPTPTAEATAEPSAEPSAEPVSEPVNDPAADAPNDESSVYAQDVSLNNPLTTDVTPPPVSCAALGLSQTCGAYVDLGTVEYLATSLVTSCTTPSGACTAAVNAARGAIGLAAACISALDLGVTAADLAIAGEPGVALDCGYAARTAMDTAAKAMTAVNACTSGATAACVTVYDAIDMATDRARGCVKGALGQADLTVQLANGTDPGCGNAVYVLQGAATQLSGLVQNCKDGGGFCATLTQVAEFLLDELPGCTNAFVVTVQDGFVAPPFPAGGGYTCYAVLDQVNIWLSDVSTLSPRVPYRLSLAPDCSVTVPGVPGTNGTPDNMLVPACVITPDTGWIRTPGMAMPGPSCQYEKWVEPAENHATRYGEKDRATWHNRSKTQTVHWTSGYNQRWDDELTWQYASELEAKALFAKVKMTATVGVRETYSYEFHENIDMILSPNNVGVASFGFGRWVQGGFVHERLEDCSTMPVKKITILAPYSHSGWSDQAPYQE